MGTPWRGTAPPSRRPGGRSSRAARARPGGQGSSRSSRDPTVPPAYPHGMDLAELADRLVPFARAMYDDPFARVDNVHAMPGHAGFSYGFTVRSEGGEES